MAEQKAGGFGNRYKFNGKELDALSGLYYYGERFYDPVVGNWLRVDPMAEKMPAWNPYNYTFNNPVRFIDPTRAIPTPYEASLIASHVYGDSNVKLEGGWVQSTRTFGIHTGSTQSGLRSMIYERTIDNKTEFVYAFAGTENLKDVSHDITQAFGKSGQYTEAISNSTALDESLGEMYELTFVGHSLGGSEAAASSYATGRKAITFNAAGVSQSTLNNNGVSVKKGSMNDNIAAFIMTSDPLNFFQNKQGLSDPNIGLMPDVDGTRLYISPSSNASRLNGHSISNMINEIKRIFEPME